MKKRVLAIFLALALTLSGCFAFLDDQGLPPETVGGGKGPDVTDAPTPADSTDAPDDSTQTPDDPTDAPDDPTEASGGDRDAPEYGAYFYDVENVVLYLEAYGELPPNYITKNEARSLGWEGGSVEDYRDGAAIGGDRFGNYEGLLPEAPGRTWTECDIDTHGYPSRGSRRLVFSSDGLYYYTSDHYESFTEVRVTENGEVVW